MDSQAIRELFRQKFGAEPTVASVAPGRINLIGEHTDYNGGFVFPAAIDRLAYVAARVVEGPTEVYSAEIGDGESFDATSAQPGSVNSWAKYPAGMAWAFRDAGKKVPNIQAVISSGVPSSGGVSSSAALEMAFGVAWNALGEFGFSNPEIAKLGQICENKFVGVNCGIMDQMASAMGKDARAMFLDTRSLEIQYAPLPAGLSAVLLDTKKPRALTDSAYNERRSQCEEAAAALGVKELRDATMEQLEAKKAALSEVVYRRAKHVITEDDRCVAFAAALDRGDLAKVGELMKASHVSLRDDYEVSCAELDLMAEAAWAAPGVVGARMTGAGFGGSCVALVYTDQVAAFIESSLGAYNAKSQYKGEAMVCQVVEGARLV